jgi:hypothetical protein
MTSIAFIFTTSDIDYSVLTGTKKNPILQTKGKLVLPANHNVSQTVEWFETELNLLLNSIKPQRVSYKLTITNVTNNYVSNVYYGQAILNLICVKKNIAINHISPSSIKPGKLNLPKETNLYAHVENCFGKQSSPWDKGMKETTIIALLNLD